MAERKDINPKELVIAYIGGGSRGWAWGFMSDLAGDPEMCGTVRLYDIDRSAAERNRVIGNAMSAHPDAASRWKYEVSDSLQDALTGAHFVVISILPATFKEMQSDVHLPERVGVWQPVGDTVGAGGFMRAMRTIPMYVTIAEAIRGEGDKLRLRIDEIHHLLLRLLLLVVGLLTTTKATETAEASETTTLGCVLLRLDAVQNALGLGLVVDARVIAPTVRGEDEGGNEV
jgi:hypothetical protein